MIQYNYVYERGTFREVEAASLGKDQRRTREVANEQHSWVRKTPLSLENDIGIFCGLAHWKIRHPAC